MRLPFLELPGEVPPITRPAAKVRVEGFEQPLVCLLDSGALAIRMGSWVADSAGISLVGAPRAPVTVGGVVAVGRCVETSLWLGPYTWRAPVWFCDRWESFGFGLLGQQGFFSHFAVTIRADLGWTECLQVRA